MGQPLKRHSVRTVLAALLAFVLACPAYAWQAATSWKQAEQVAALEAALGPDAPTVDELVTLSRLLAHPIDQLKWLVERATEASKGGKGDVSKALAEAFTARVQELSAEAQRVPALRAQLAKAEVDALASIVAELSKPPPPPPVAENPWGGAEGDPQKPQFDTAFAGLTTAFGSNLSAQIALLSAPPASGEPLATIDRIVRALVRHRLQVDPLRGDDAAAWRAAHDTLSAAKLTGWAAIAKTLEALGATDASQRTQAASQATAWAQSRVAAAASGSDAAFLRDALAPLLGELAGAGDDIVRNFATGGFYAKRRARLAPLEDAVRSAATAAQSASGDADQRAKVGALWEAMQRLKDARVAALEADWQPLSLDTITDATKFRSSTVKLFDEQSSIVFVELVSIDTPRQGMAFGHVGVLVSVKRAGATGGARLQHAVAIAESDAATMRALFDATVRYGDGAGQADGLRLNEMSALIVSPDRFPSDEIAARGALRAIWRESDVGNAVPAYFAPSSAVIARKCFKGAAPKIWNERNTRLSWLSVAGSARGLVGGPRMSDTANLFGQRFPAVALHGNAEQARGLRNTSAELRAAMRAGDGTIVVLLDPD